MADDQPRVRVEREPRIRTEFEALYSSGRTEGAGALVDISYTGARFAAASFAPPIGAEIRAYVFIQPVSPFPLQGRVVRSDPTGFAIEWEKADDEVRRFVDDAAAIVAPPRRR
jgi:hypothetical protein